MFVVAVLVKGRLEVPAYVILLSWLLLTVQSYMGPLVFSRVLAMTASLSQQSFSIGKDCFFYQALCFLGFFFSKLVILTSILCYVMILKFALCTE